MSCVLRAIGTAFDVDAFLADSPLRGSAVFRRGEPRLPTVSDGPSRSASGFNVTVSEAGFEELALQVEDAVGFLRRYEAELRRLASFPGVEEVCLDFGVSRREVGAQSAVFPAELLWRAGALDIDLVVTHYALTDAPVTKSGSPQ